MSHKNNVLAVAFSVLLGILPQWALAENVKDIGDYTIYYNAFISDILSPEIARQYGIVRSKTRAVLNINVLKKVMGTPGQPVKAVVKATATNLTGQLKALPMREIREQNAIYYLSQFIVAHDETLDFRVEVQPLGQPDAYTVEFRQKFYTR